MIRNDWLDKKIEKTDILPDKIYDAWRLRMLNQEDFHNLTIQDQLLYLSHFGLLAPSTHNSVPERFKIIPEESAIELWLDRKFILKASDAVGREACISLGCTMTNIEIAAKYYQYETSRKFFTITSNDILPFEEKGKRYARIAKLTLKKGSRTLEKKWIAAIINRKVVRSEYDERKKPSEIIKKQLQQLSKKLFRSLSLRIITDKAEIYKLGKFEEMATRSVFENDRFALELGSLLLPNKNKNSVIGMRGQEFGFDDQFSERIHKGLLHEIRLLPDEIAALATGGKIAMKSSPAIGIISVSEDSIEQRIYAGALYEYIALLLSMNGFFTAFHAGIVEVDRVNRMLSVFLKTVERPTVVFRIGKPLNSKDLNRPHSARPQIEEVLLT